MSGEHKSSSSLGSSEDESIRSWWETYRKDVSSALREIDAWYEQFRRDFVPDRSGRVQLSKSVQKSVDAPVRNVPVRKFEYVGHGDVTNSSCGRFLGFSGCLNPKHKNGLIWAYKVFKSCDSPKCSRCYKFGWASRLASFVEPRLIAASKVFGDIEHVVCSLRKEDHDLSYEEMKNKVIQVLKSCSFLGGFMILHAKSFGKFRPHFHCLLVVGAIGGAERCRHCKGGDCYRCDGIEGRCLRAYADTGYIVRVFDKRKTLGGTVKYESSHCTINYHKRRFRVSTWWGVMGYSNFSKLGVEVEKRRLLCPQCQSVCGPIEYLGGRTFDLDRDSVDFVRASLEPRSEGGKIVWRVRESVKPLEEGD